MKPPGLQDPEVRAGLERMSRSSVVVCGLAHQCAKSLPRTLEWVDRLRACFRDSAVVVFENESRDRTLEVLKDWAGRGRGVTILSRPFPGELRGAPTPGVDPSFALARIRRIAWARNRYLDHVRRHHAPDYLLTLDFDLCRVALAGVASTFSRAGEWDAVFSNSRGFFRYRFWLGRVYWDTFAYKPFHDEKPQTERQIYQSQRDLQRLEPGMPLLRVDSAFGGLAVYRWQAFGDCRYAAVPNADDRVESVCEHITMHRCMASTGHRRMFINPSQLVIYDTLAGKILWGLRVLARRFLRFFGLRDF